MCSILYVLWCVPLFSTSSMLYSGPVQYAVGKFTANEVDPSPECTWSLSSSVKSLTYSRGSDYVYAVTETRVSYTLCIKFCCIQ